MVPAISTILSMISVAVCKLGGIRAFLRTENKTRKINKIQKDF